MLCEFPLSSEHEQIYPRATGRETTAEDNQPAQPARLGSVQMLVCSLPWPSPSLLSCSSFVQGEMVQMLCAGYAQHDFDLPFLSLSSNSKQPLQPFRAKKSLGIRRIGKLAF